MMTEANEYPKRQSEFKNCKGCPSSVEFNDGNERFWTCEQLVKYPVNGCPQHPKGISPIEERLINVLKDGPYTRKQLVRKIGKARTTIYDGLSKLIKKNEVKKSPFYVTEMLRGRPPVLFELLSNKK